VQQPAITSTFNNATGEGVKRDYLAAITATLLEKSICNAMIRNLSIWLESVRHHAVTGSETPCPITILKTEITYSEIGLHCQEEMFLIQKISGFTGALLRSPRGSVHQDANFAAGMARIFVPFGPPV
jgi:hypothetical protein